jgi:G3E family GTPase
MGGPWFCHLQVDLVSAEERRQLLGLLRTLNPGAELIPTRQSHVSLDRVINTGRFSLEQAARRAGWLQVPGLPSRRKAMLQLTCSCPAQSVALWRV